MATFKLEHNKGDFRFNGLLVYLKSYNAPKVVTIAEDPTSVIARVEYDSETDRLVGFVLPCNNRGLPLTEAFLAVSFKAIKKPFQLAL